MGVEIIQSDRNFINFLNTLLPPEKKAQPGENAHAGPATAQAENKPPTAAKNRPEARPKKEQYPESDEIDSMISSLFSRRDKK